jgi:hypothetical protein
VFTVTKRQSRKGWFLESNMSSIRAILPEYMYLTIVVNESVRVVHLHDSLLANGLEHRYSLYSHHPRE